MKVKEFQERLRKEGIDFALFCNTDSMNYDPDMLYFAGYKGIGAMVIPAKAKPFIVLPEMELGRKKSNRIRHYRLKSKKKLFEETFHIIKSKKIKARTIGINKNAVSLNLFKPMQKCMKARYDDVSGIVSKTRETKTEGEIRLIKRACRATDAIFSDIVSKLRQKKFRSESDICRHICRKTEELGCEVAFKPIVASGKGASVPHYEAQDVRLRKGFLVMDFGARHKDYNSDMTRTVYIGDPSSKEVLLYNLVLKVQERCIRKIRQKRYCADIYAYAKKELGSFSENFTHGLGHGIGINVHENPNLSELSGDIIAANMVFTVEPGIYLQNKAGIRIEDTLVMKNRAVRLTRSSKGLLILPKP